MLTDKQLFLFDIDGTLCLGDTWIDGARELLALLKAQGKHYLFLTNNSTKSQLDYVEKFQKMGLTVDKEEILTASMATGILLRDLYPNRKFYALGTRSFEEEMRSYGVELTTNRRRQKGCWRLTMRSLPMANWWTPATFYSGRSFPSLPPTRIWCAQTRWALCRTAVPSARCWRTPQAGNPGMWESPVLLW